VTTRCTNAALLSLALATLAACAGGPAARGAAPGPTPAAASYEESIARHRADSLRAALLARAGWPSSGADRCDAGVLRVFPGDTTAVERARTERLIEGLETLIVSRGLDAPPSSDLLRAILAWEANGARPRWDVAGGESAERRAIAPGLSGRFANPQTGRCESYVALDTATFVVPALARFEAPRVKGVRLGVISGGDSALARARAAHFARATAGGGADSAFAYARVAPIVTWGDYGLATVRRQNELPGGGEARTNDGVNASYLFHRVAGEWRLLAIARSW